MGVSTHFPALASQPLGRFDRLVKKHERDMDDGLMVSPGKRTCARIPLPAKSTL
jgi:hypothetical protein